MNFFKTLVLSFLTILLTACNGGNSDLAKKVELYLNEGKTSFQQGDTVFIALKKQKNTSIDSLVYFLNGQKIAIQQDRWILDSVPLGIQKLEVKLYSDGKEGILRKSITVLSNTPPEVYTIRVLNEFPHDISAYTQGLEFENDTLYEGTGRYGQSYLRKLDFETGKVLNEVALNESYFGEGISIMNNTIYQLTWQNGVGFMYDLDTMKKTGTFNYDKSKQGWGLCNDGQNLYKSDGTEKIWILNPQTLQEEGYIQITSHAKVYTKVNELEFANGKIYANSYQNDGIMIIDPKTGALLGVVDGRSLKERVLQHKEIDVLNGIAYHPGRKTFFLTGKNWNKLFEVEFLKKD
ncbi:glutaminyl-peptide cyclotransferase [Ascidiimonas aurantiaca]|uniref:glutaminyl-peptide cyclotransferase n=1 Tax=Ascidiimonas aurantiaca TaxID=1685432 RepID=UPI0030ECEBCF